MYNYVLTCFVFLRQGNFIRTSLTEGDSSKIHLFRLSNVCFISLFSRGGSRGGPGPPWLIQTYVFVKIGQNCYLDALLNVHSYQYVLSIYVITTVVINVLISSLIFIFHALCTQPTQSLLSGSAPALQ